MHIGKESKESKIYKIGYWIMFIGGGGLVLLALNYQSEPLLFVAFAVASVGMAMRLHAIFSYSFRIIVNLFNSGRK